MTQRRAGAGTIWGAAGDTGMKSYGLLRLALRLAGSSLLHRGTRPSIAARLAALPVYGLPVTASVEIRWDDHLVPFIAAESDRDLAVALGLVHAHLRLAQIEIIRQAAQARLSETLGPVAVPLDHTIRVLDPTRAVPEIERRLPAATREWLDGFAAGINHHLANARELPVELQLLGVRPRQWQVSDVLDVARLAAADVTWLLWLRLLPLRGGAGWPQLWRRLLEDGEELPAAPSANGAQALEQVVRGLGGKGSNAFAVAGSRSFTGRPFLAGDPHLSLSLPSVWLAAAYHSPSYNVAGLMIPGIPVMAVGRNPYLAWGGTNLHAASSELFDIADLSPSDIAERRVRLNVRWADEQNIVLRETRYGPVLSDAPAFAGAGTVAFRWIGHLPSDEVTALLAINRARDGAAFRAAAQGLAVPGQNLVYAEAAGGIGHIAAAHLPRRPATPPADIVSPVAAAQAWTNPYCSADFPATIDPPRGFVASANDRPPRGEVPVGWFFSLRDRADRLAELLEDNAPVGLPALTRMQRDVESARMRRLRDRLCAALPPNGDLLRTALAAWDGRYETDSAGALAFELVFARVAAAVVPAGSRMAYGVVWHSRDLIAREIAGLGSAHLSEIVGGAAAEAAASFAELRDWGGAHRLRLSHPLARIPVIGRRWRGTDWAWPGSTDTLLKSGHGPVTGRHAVTYGSNARYLFDLDDPNGNYLVVLGGQDGVYGSPAFADQLAMFRRGEYLCVPLEIEAARSRFPHVTIVQPG